MRNLDYWQYHDFVGGYYIWRSPDNSYQVTKGPTPPDTLAGYYNLQALLRMKGLASA